MNVLTLNIKQKYFDGIVSGTKRKEYREVMPFNFHKYGRITVPHPGGREYANWDDVPEEFSGSDWALTPVKYDALKLITGAYKGKRPYMIVGVESAEINILTDEDGNDIIIGEGTENEYYATQVCYNLGKIIELNKQNKQNNQSGLHSI